MGLAFFDPDVSVTVKRKMVQALNSEQKPTDNQSAEKRPKRVTLVASKASDVSLETFVSQHTRQLFNKLCISDC